MGKPVLLLRLEGPLQSWGVRSRWDVRDTATEPTKSGVIGLLGCALGYAMRDSLLEELDRALRFGVRVEHAGVVVTDYQTITDYLPTAAGEWKARGDKRSKSIDSLHESDAPPATIISPRAYLEDAAFLVALEAKETGDIVASCAQAVQNPQWPLFLGRKACVSTRPIFEYFGNDYNDIEDALKHRRWEWLGACHQLRRQTPDGQLAAFIEDENGTLTQQDAMRLNASRTYGFRPVLRAFFTPVLAANVEAQKTVDIASPAPEVT